MNAMLPVASDDALPPELRDLLNSPDGATFEQALDVMVRQREQRLFRALGQLARDLHDAVRRLGGELMDPRAEPPPRGWRGLAGGGRAIIPSPALATAAGSACVSGRIACVAASRTPADGSRHA